MELIETEAKPIMMAPAEESEAPTETEPPEADRSTEPGGPGWPLWVLVILIAAGLIAGLIFLARWIYHETKHTTSINQPSTSLSQNGKKSSSSSSSSGVISLGGGHSGNSNKPGSKTSSGGQKTRSLPNNGPGNVIGVFAAASFAAGALHYILSLRKAAREN